MKSKICFFNKTILLKNITLYWPIWSLYLLFLLFTMPGMLWINFTQEKNYSSVITPSQKISILADVLDMEVAVVSVFFVAVVIGMALYNYLYVARSANMIHALPVTRTELFGTNLLCGLGFMLIPQILSFLLSMLVCLEYGVTHVEYLAQYLLMQMGMSILAFSMVTFCAMMTGQLFALPVFYIIALFLYVGVRKVFQFAIVTLGFGISKYHSSSYDHLSGLSPARYLWDEVYFTRLYKTAGADGEEVCYGLRLENGYAVALYLLVAVVLFMLAYICYQKRMLEDAGDFITIGFVRPIFRWGMGGIAGGLGALVMYSLLTEGGIPISKWVLLLLETLIGGMCFFLSDMLLRKNFRVFQRKRVIECGAFLCLMVLGGLGTNMVAHQMEIYLPELSQIKFAYLEMGESVEFRGEEAAGILEIHRDLVKYIDEYRGGNFDGNYLDFNVRYVLKNGKVVDRSYVLPENITKGNICERIREINLDGHNFLKGYFTYYYKDDSVINFTEGFFELYSGEENAYAVYQGDKNLSPKEMEILFEAVKKDCEAGTLQKYNLYDNYGFRKNENAYNNQIGFFFKLKLPKAEDKIYQESLFYQYGGDYLDNENYDTLKLLVTEGLQEQSAYLWFGEDCENIIQALLELGIINSKDELVMDFHE